MKNWREPVFVVAAILGLYGFYLYRPIYSVPEEVAFAFGGLYALFAVFRLKRDFDSRVSGTILRFLLRLLAAAILFAAGTVTTLL